LTHPNHEVLNRHAAAAVAVPTNRGWRLDKGAEGVQIDALVALGLALELAERQRPEPVRLLGFI
jgi:hypothetical protein